MEWSADALSGVFLCPYVIVLVNTGVEVHNCRHYQRIQVYFMRNDDDDVDD